MHITPRRSGWRFQIRVPRDLEDVFGRSPIRLNLGPVGKRDAARTARLQAGHAESVFVACRKGAGMTKDELIEELQEMLVGAMDMAESIAVAAERRRVAEMKTVTLNLMTEHHHEQLEMGRRLQSLGGGIESLQHTIARLPKPQRDTLVVQITELSALVKQSLEGGETARSARRNRNGHFGGSEATGTYLTGARRVASAHDPVSVIRLSISVSLKAVILSPFRSSASERRLQTGKYVATVTGKLPFERTSYKRGT